MIKFPSIEQFRTAIKNVQHRAHWAGRDETGEPVFDRSRPIPKLRYRGTVKLHGTNAGVVYDVGTESLSYQSRERELSLTQDNAGFMLYMMGREEYLREIMRKIFIRHTAKGNRADTIVLFGEWCGGNIQKSVAICELPKMFVIFGIKALYMDDDGQEISQWIDVADFASDFDSDEHRIYNVLKFGSWDVTIDFANAQLAQNRLIEITEDVEKECPAGAHFNVSGVGEGVVWQCVEDGWRTSEIWFKVKGEKHSVSKVKTLAPVDTEAFQKVADFVAATVTEARLEQGLQNLINEQLKPFEMSSMGDFIRWVFNDVIKEETDTIIASQLDPKKLGGPIANAARPWYIQRLNAQ